ncbi:MAG: acetyl-CoA carboxylase biotin carboxyl carrier protein, partial [Planctomycetales bacterium]|nr:acetyl-CoA carboxylase biotin carboxyl carrier protein [Planctomycetales bacterium]
MANPTPNSGEIFDVRKIRRLVELMNEHELSEIDLRQADTRIRLRRGAEPIVTVAPTSSAPAPVKDAATAPPAAAKPSADSANIAYVTSPMVGTFYSAANPESAPFVKVGDAVGKETTVCIIEAMKVFNEIPAEVAGK